MEPLDWIALFFVLAPVWIGLGYGLLRLTGRVRPPEGLPPGRRGGMSRVNMSGVPLSDAPAYAQKLKRQEEEEKARASEDAPRLSPPTRTGRSRGPRSSA